MDRFVITAHFLGLIEAYASGDFSARHKPIS